VIVWPQLLAREDVNLLLQHLGFLGVSNELIFRLELSPIPIVGVIDSLEYGIVVPSVRLYGVVTHALKFDSSGMLYHQFLGVNDNWEDGFAIP